MLRDDSGNGDGRPNMPLNVLGDRLEICSAAAWLLVHYPYGPRSLSQVQAYIGLRMSGAWPPASNAL
jgi:hypothetical protein